MYVSIYHIGMYMYRGSGERERERERESGRHRQTEGDRERNSKHNLRLSGLGISSILRRLMDGSSMRTQPKS